MINEPLNRLLSVIGYYYYDKDCSKHGKILYQLATADYETLTTDAIEDEMNRLYREATDNSVKYVINDLMGDLGRYFIAMRLKEAIDGGATADDFRKVFSDLNNKARKRLLRSDRTIFDEMLITIMIDEFGSRKRLTNSTMRPNEYIWYVDSNRKLAYVKNTPRNLRFFNKLVKDGKIVLRHGHYVAIDPIDDSRFVETKRHRAFITGIKGSDRWNQTYIDRFCDLMDGGKSCSMVIDKDFYLAYEPDYHYNEVYMGDLVTGCSCMSERPDGAQEFYGKIENCYVARFISDDGENVGRCIVYQHPDGRRHFIRIYAHPDYQVSAYNLLKREMKDGDLFGREERFEELCLNVGWDGDEQNFYLDGDYTIRVYNGRLVLATRGYGDYAGSFESTSSGSVYEGFCDGVNRCRICGDWFVDGFCIDGDCYCSEDCALNDGYERCEHCGELTRCPDYVTDDGRAFCCKSCLEYEGLFACSDCDKIHDSSDGLLNICGNWYCDEECATDSGCVKCDICGDWCLRSSTIDYLTTKDDLIIVQHRCTNCYTTISSRQVRIDKDLLDKLSTNTNND